MKFNANYFFAFIVLSALSVYTLQAEPLKKKKFIEKKSARKPAATEYKGALRYNGRPVPGVIVRISGETVAKTNKQGDFTINANMGDTLLISLSGYKEVHFVLSELTSFSINLERDDIKDEPSRPVELIYTTVPPDLTTASNDAVYNREILKTPVTSFRNALTGRLAGLYTLQTSGLPGSDGSSLTLRGQSPVVIIDGVVANLTAFDLEEIESVTVLKDAIGTAMLGVRGSGGAVLVTTKKGKVGHQQISFTAQTAVQQSLGYPKTLNAFQYATLYNEARVNDGLTALYPDSVLQAYQNHTNSYAYPDVNWRDEITKKTSTFNRFTLSATGGNRFARYFVSLENVNQAGFFRTVDSNSYNTNNNFKSYVIRSNVDVNITNKLTGGIYLLGRILNGNEPGATAGTILSNLLNTPANAYPVLNRNGSFAGTSQFQNNLLAQTIGSGYRQNYKRDMLVNLYLKRALDEITPGLWIQAKAAYYASLSEDINRSKSFAVYQQSAATGAYTTYGTNGTQSNVQSIAYQASTDYEELSIGYNRTFSSVHGINTLVLANRDNSRSGNADLPYTIVGTSGRIAYDYKGKYVIEGAFGLNGSNRYPDNGDTKLGFFPSIGLGWNLEKEEFLKGNNVLSRLRIYGSYGKTGNDNPGYFVYIQRYFDAAGVPFGTSAGNNTTITEQILANPNITFEKAKKLNAGVDGAVLNNRLSFKVEYFRNKYYDLLMQRGRNTSLIGNNYPNENIGINRYYGWEAQVSWQQSVNSFQYFISANASSVGSEVLYMDEVFQRYDWMKRTGQPVGQRFGYMADGLFQSQSEISSSATLEGYTPKPGDIKYRDLNSDGIINQFDIAPIGTTKPLFFYGVSLGASWKGFDISALVQGVQNRDVYLSGGSYWAFQNNGLGQAYENNLNRWTPANAANATYPRITIGTNENNQATSSFWSRSGNYLRLRNAEIGYSLPPSLTGKIHLQSLRVFANGYNLLTHASSEIDDRDPEVYDGSAYPVQRVINFGINIKF